MNGNGNKHRRQSWGPTIRQQIWEVQDGQCFYCAKSLESFAGIHMHLDHVDPLGRQGPDKLENLVAACIGCNLEKSDKEFPELLAAFEGKLPGAIIAARIAEATHGQIPKCQFHLPHNERREQLRLQKEAGKQFDLKDPLDFYDLPEVVARFKVCAVAAPDSEQWTSGLWVELCRFWEACGRPYYNIYPVVVDALSRTRLGLTAREVCGNLVEFSRIGIAVCFALGYEPTASGEAIEQLRVSVVSSEESSSGGCFYVIAHTNGQNGPRVHTYHADLSQRLDQEGLAVDDGEPDSLYQLATRLAIGVLLLAQDDRFLEPILLAKDRERDLTPDQRQQAIERACRRTQMRGFAIGRDWIASPHVRRPHFAIRWTGEGRTTPRLVAVKGCIVRRSELLTVPTGYQVYGDESLS